MTKKDFAMIAKVLAEARKTISSREDLLSIIEMFAEELSNKYPRFDTRKFLKTSGYWEF